MPKKKNGKNILFELSKWVTAIIAIFGPIGWIILYFEPPVFQIKDLTRGITALAYIIFLLFLYIIISKRFKK